MLKSLLNAYQDTNKRAQRIIHRSVNCDGLQRTATNYDELMKFL
jgi:hypothetical protein